MLELIFFYLGAGSFNAATKYAITRSATVREVLTDIGVWPYELWKVFQK
jgi:hypothetical protein